MDNYFFAFGPNDSYLYNGPDGWGRSKVPYQIEQLFVNAQISEIIWAAFGPHKDMWFFAYIDRMGNLRMITGDVLPYQLREWLYDPATDTPRRDKHIRVVLGPNASFFAWDSRSIRWGELPEDLEETVQGWLSPAGWKAGPPRIIALGREGSWFALSQYGAVASNIPSEFEVLAETWEDWKTEGLDHVNFLYVAFDTCTPGQFVAIRTDGEWSGCIDDDNAAALQAFAESMISPPKGSERKASPREISNGKASFKPAAKDPVKLYAAWNLQCSTMINRASESPLTSFPPFPPGALHCESSSCAPHKADELGLQACRHDIEFLLRGSGKYSYEWLRKERLVWHPDRFSRLCAAEFREEGSKKAEELYKIIEVLMREEKERLDRQG